MPFKTILVAVSALLFLLAANVKLAQKNIVGNFNCPEKKLGTTETDTLPVIRANSEGIYKIEKVLEQHAHFFSKADVIQISAAKGMLHYRKGKQLQNYKIIPRYIRYSFQPQCATAPCPTVTKIETVYFMGGAARFVRTSGKIFFISAKEFADNDSSIGMKKEDWIAAYEIKRLAKLP